MLQRDYIMRLIDEFMAALGRMLEKKELGSRREQLVDLYRQYVGPYDELHAATVDEALAYIARYGADERLERTQMLAELYYAEARLACGAERDALLGKAFALFELIDRQSHTFSIDRRHKMADIKRLTQDGGRK